MKEKGLYQSRLNIRVISVSQKKLRSFLRDVIPGPSGPFKENLSVLDLSGVHKDMILCVIQKLYIWSIWNTYSAFNNTYIYLNYNF